jgi:formiminoglutamase
VALLGLPDDLGVTLNHGRAGARAGPGAFRAALGKYGCAWDAVAGRELSAVVWDAGDVTPAGGESEESLHETHRRVTEAAGTLHRAGLTVVCVGGGHDLTFGAVRAFSKHVGGAIGGANVDPHLDVRATVGSGMAFRSLIEAGAVEAKRFTTLGVGRFANTREHSEWLRARGGTIVPVDAVKSEAAFRMTVALQHAAGGLSLASQAAAPVFVSFDLDSLDAAHAPGVSAPNPQGLTPQEAAAIAEAAGRDSNVRHFDLMELNPAHDEQGRTARVAALLFLSFLAGFEARLHPPAREGRA